MFSNLLDITGFFVSVLINLLLIALICYYFKRKIDNLEYSQSEQAKTLYTLISQQNTLMNNESKNIVIGGNDIMSGLDLTQLQQSSHDDPYHSENNDEESESESESDEEEEDVVEEERGDIAEDKSIVIQPINMVSPEECEEDVKQIEFDNSAPSDNEQEQEEVGSRSEIVEDVGDEICAERAEEQEESSENYEKMTVRELKNVLAEKGVHAKSSMNKGDIINILKGTDTVEVDVEENDVNKNI